MDRAKRLLVSADISVTDICFEIGYASLGSFSLKFRSLVGRTPTEYQREVRRIFGYSAPWRGILFLPDCFATAFSAFQ